MRDTDSETSEIRADVTAQRRLSQINTAWTLVRHMHGGESGNHASACASLLKRYGDAVRRYLRKAVRNAEAADELYQEFGLRLVQGRFQAADPSRGRFRDYVKTSLYHLIADYWRRQGRRMSNLNTGLSGVAIDPTSGVSSDQAFLEGWRESLLARTWRRLSEWEQSSGQLFHSVLRLRVQHPQWGSAELAGRVGQRVGRSLSEGATRVMLHRARRKFAELLVEDVADSLNTPTREQLEDELIALNLLDYCRHVLKA